VSIPANSIPTSNTPKTNWKVTGNGVVFSVENSLFKLTNKGAVPNLTEEKAKLYAIALAVVDSGVDLSKADAISQELYDTAQGDEDYVTIERSVYDLLMRYLRSIAKVKIIPIPPESSEEGK